MNRSSKSVYIHIPFCKSICSYCDFCKVFYHEQWVQNYLKCLKNEIKDFYLNEELESIYIGGGTPSSLSKKNLESLFLIVSILNRSVLKEFTFECNIDDINEELLEILKRNGVNRLSIGLQSTYPEKLKVMGRNHSFLLAQEKMQLCRNWGFTNINIDFMFGFSFENTKMVKKDLKQVLKLKPDHLSCYSLILEEHTLLSIYQKKQIEEDMDASIYNSICKLLKKKGFVHYEISNFARPGCASIHNLRYWQNKEYYGFGLSASGYIDNIRYTNTKSLTKYLKNAFAGEKELLTQQDVMDNHLMLGFRLINGFNIEEFEKLYQVKLEDCYPIKPLLKNGDLMLKKGNIFINPDKLYIMNEILLKMI